MWLAKGVMNIYNKQAHLDTMMWTQRHKQIHILDPSVVTTLVQCECDVAPPPSYLCLPHLDSWNKELELTCAQNFELKIGTHVGIIVKERCAKNGEKRRTHF